MPLTAIYVEPMNESNGEYGGAAIVFSDNPQATETVRDKKVLLKNLHFVFNLAHDYLCSGNEQFISANSLQHTLFKLGAHPTIMQIMFAQDCDGCEANLEWIEGDNDNHTGSSSILDNRKMKLHISRHDHKRVEGTVKYADADKHLAFYVAFALDLGKFGWQTEPQQESALPPTPPPPPPPVKH